MKGWEKQTDSSSPHGSQCHSFIKWYAAPDLATLQGDRGASGGSFLQARRKENCTRSPA